MPVTRRSRTLSAEPADVWRTVGDPYGLPRWWPQVERVEQVSRSGFTQVLRGPKTGRLVRADFRLVVLDAPTDIAWEQELEDTAFARVLRFSRTSVRVGPHRDGGTIVDLMLEQKLQGFALLGGLMVRRAARSTLDGALDGLAALHG